VLEPSATIAPIHTVPRTALQIASRLGYRRVTLSAAQEGVRPRELDRSARRGLIAELRRLELRCDAIDLFVPPEHYVLPEHVDRAVDAARGALELAGDLGAEVLFLRLPAVEDGSEPLEAVRALAAFADAGPVRIADVSLDGPAAKAFDQGDALPIGVGLDTAAWLADGRDPLEGIVSLGEHLAGIRLVDIDETGTRVPVASGGRADIEALRVAIQTGATTRALVADARGWADPAGGLQQTLTAWGTCGGVDG
jgi:sugar phosphate isomerase/epimerase